MSDSFESNKIDQTLTKVVDARKLQLRMKIPAEKEIGPESLSERVRENFAKSKFSFFSNKSFWI